MNAWKRFPWKWNMRDLLSDKSRDYFRVGERLFFIDCSLSAMETGTKWKITHLSESEQINKSLYER